MNASSYGSNECLSRATRRRWVGYVMFVCVVGSVSVLPGRARATEGSGPPGEAASDPFTFLGAARLCAGFGLGTRGDNSIPWGISFGGLLGWPLSDPKPEHGLFVAFDLMGYQPSVEGFGDVDVDIEGLAFLTGGGIGYAYFPNPRSLIGLGLYYLHDKSGEGLAVVVDGEEFPLEFEAGTFGLGADVLWLSGEQGEGAVGLSAEVVFLFSSENAQSLLRVGLAYGGGNQ